MNAVVITQCIFSFRRLFNFGKTIDHWKYRKIRWKFLKLQYWFLLSLLKFQWDCLSAESCTHRMWDLVCLSVLHVGCVGIVCWTHVDTLWLQRLLEPQHLLLGNIEYTRMSLILLVITQSLFQMGPVHITSWYPEFNGSHFGLPHSKIHRMTGLGGKMVWTMTYSHRPHWWWCVLDLKLRYCFSVFSDVFWCDCPCFKLDVLQGWFAPPRKKTWFVSTSKRNETSRRVQETDGEGEWREQSFLEQKK